MQSVDKNHIKEIRGAVEDPGIEGAGKMAQVIQ